MFGYINVNYRELTEEQKKQYQSYYCGLCQQLNRSVGKKGQVLLNYDMTFLVLLLTGLYEPINVKEEFTCMLHPMHKKTSRINEVTEYCAKMNVLLAYQNFKDDWKDHRSVPKKAMMKLLEKDYKAIALEYPRQAKAVEDAIKRLDVAEYGKESNIDIVSGFTGEMLAEIFNWKDDAWADELKCMGFYMGKFIYLMDAYLDLEQDRKMHCYNPFLYYHQPSEHGVDTETYVRLVLNSMMTECAKSFERMPILKNADLIRNILYSGVWTKYEAGANGAKMKSKGKETKK